MNEQTTTDAGGRYRIQRWDGKVWVSAGQQPWDLKQNAVDVANDLHRRMGDTYRVLDRLMKPVYTTDSVNDLDKITREDAIEEIKRLRKLLMPFGVEPDRAAYLNFVDWLDEDQEQTEFYHQAVVEYFKERGISPADELF